MKPSHFSKDVQEFLCLLDKYRVKYVIVGGEAVIYYGYARLTGDIDFYFEPVQENATRLYNALNQFWDGEIPEIESKEELLEPNVIIQFGVPPNRIDLINKIEGVIFNEAWEDKAIETINYNDQIITVYYIGIRQLIKNKASLERPKDLDDLKYLKKRIERDNL